MNMLLIRQQQTDVVVFIYLGFFLIYDKYSRIIQILTL